MTLIAALMQQTPAGRVAALLGDSLLTEEIDLDHPESEGDREPLFLPHGFQPDEEGSPFRMRYLAQKVVRVSDRLCVAWTGSFWEARELLQMLREQDPRDPEDLREWMRAYDDAGARDVGFVAFLGDGKGSGRVFDFGGPGDLALRKGGSPENNFVLAGGSGAEPIIGALGGLLFDDVDGLGHGPVGAARTVLGHCYAEERRSGLGLVSHGFGGAYDLVIAAHDGFLRLEHSVALLTADILRPGEVRVAAHTNLVHMEVDGLLVIVSFFVTEQHGARFEVALVASPLTDAVDVERVVDASLDRVCLANDWPKAVGVSIAGPHGHVTNETLPTDSDSHPIIFEAVPSQRAPRVHVFEDRVGPLALRAFEKHGRGVETAARLRER